MSAQLYDKSLGSSELKEPRIRWHPDPLMRRSNFNGKDVSGHSPKTFCGELLKNGWTDRDAVWFLDSGWPNEAAKSGLFRALLSSVHITRHGPWTPVKGKKGKEEYLYSAFLHQGTHKEPRHGWWITQFYLQTTPCLPFLLGVHQMSPPQQLR